MSVHPDGRWHLFVASAGSLLSNNAVFIWPQGSPVPTPAARREALADLGYQGAAGAEWEWCEAYPAPDHDTTNVELIASLTVQPTGQEGGARRTGERTCEGSF
ncbi:DUF6303 family protein [Streptomyces sp. NPDC008317]|uniref:DUF6303 family protein n=1 Tax=Streptomyces sp. NPDC008317 TaxID=3364827 RepID=UPI0036E32F4D